MKVYLINLDRDLDRLEAATCQLKRMEVPFERLAAVYAKQLPFEELVSCVNRFRWWCAVGRPFTPGEIGCALSHFKAWEKCDGAICVLEDDVHLDAKFKDVLTTVEQWIDPSKPQVVLLSNHSRETGDGICWSKGDMYTEGYVITTTAARAIRRCNYPLQTPCDWWGRWVKRGVIELYHAFPTVCSQDQSQYESGTTSKDGFNVGRLSFVPYCLHKFKRLIGKTLDRILPL